MLVKTLRRVCFDAQILFFRLCGCSGYSQKSEKGRLLRFSVDDLANFGWEMRRGGRTEETNLASRAKSHVALRLELFLQSWR